MFAAFADNFCARALNTVADRLVVTGFHLAGAAAPARRYVPGTAPAAPIPETPATAAWALWQAQSMARRAGRAMLDATRVGDAFVIVDKDANDQPAIYPQGKACHMTVQYDDEDLTTMQWAAKAWARHDGTVRVNLYYPDRTERYLTTQSTRGTLPTRATELALLEAPRPALLPGRIPVFHLACQADAGEFGTSDLVDILPLQNALNKATCDWMVAMEFAAYPQRWATGLEVTLDEITGQPDAAFQPGIDRFWAVADRMVKFGEFAASNLDGYGKAVDNYRVEIARVAAIPLHYVGLTSGRFPSGEALRVAEEPLTQKILDRCGSFGPTWAAVLQYALALQGNEAALETEWQDPRPKSELENRQALAIEQTLGVPQEVLWSKLGYTDAEIEVMKALKPAPLLLPAGPPTNGQRLLPAGVPALPPDVSTRRPGPR